MEHVTSLPPQMLSYRKKNKAWVKKHLDWADSKSCANYSPVRKTVMHKKINYDLLGGTLHMSDLELILNPAGIKADFIPDTIQHYPIINSKLNILLGEEIKRTFDYRVIVTNPNAISEIENNKKQELLSRLQEWVSNNSQSEEEAQNNLQKINDYITYEWQDFREVRANALLNHYVKEYNMPLMFNQGFLDAMAVGEELYLVSAISGEPTIERLNNMKTTILMSGVSNRVEDADMIILEDYWSPGRIIDTYYDVLSKNDVKKIEEYTSGHKANVDSMDNIDERYGFVRKDLVSEIDTDELFIADPFGALTNNSMLPYDMAGNIKVLRVFWKSKRKIKKVKSYNPETGEEEFNFYTEDYVINEDLGEEEQIFYINEAWQGTKIGDDIYVDMGPMPVQYNRLSNPSRCHFGIIGNIYNFNDDKPFSMVDIMKPYNYLYDMVHDKLNKLIAKNKGKLIKMDFAKTPKGWDASKWIYFIESNGIIVEDSFKEGQGGAAQGKLAGGLNNASTGVVDAELGNSIQSMINTLEYIKNEMGEAVGISKQREGQISNRETVGGVERATLQSSYITETIFAKHDDLKRRVLEAFLEQAKACLKGRNKKFNYILGNEVQMLVDIDGDEFAENDYGLAVDNSNGIQELSQKLDGLAQAALQNQALNFSTIMKLYSSISIAEKIRLVEKSERDMQERAAQEQQQQMQLQQQQIEQQAQYQQQQLQQADTLNSRDNETRILVAQINSQAEADRLALMNGDDESALNREKLEETKRQFDEKLKLDKDRLSFDKNKAKTDAELKRLSINKKPSSSK
jgi:hypothetical protein